jgi:ADP-heptose:LPS heptosyltransferase
VWENVLKRFLTPSRELAARRLEEGGHRIYDPKERAALALFDTLLRVTAPLLGLKPRKKGLFDISSARRILALRLDRIGDLIMTLPALVELRRLAPEAEIELGVGSWNEEIARGLSVVDRVRVIDAPWAAWGKRASWTAAARAMRSKPRPDLVIDFQGDVRVILLMAFTRAPLRAGFSETGGGHLLTHRGEWDESKSWYRQNVDLLQAVYPAASFPKVVEPFNFLSPEDRRNGRELLGNIGLETPSRPLIGIHPSAGRAIKQWEVEKLAALADRLVDATSATVLLTGGPSDGDLVEAVAGRTKGATHRLVTDAGVRTFAALVEQLDLFVTGDTGPMHIAHAVGAPNLAIFGPSDPVRYGPERDEGKRVVMRQPLYCSPCNMIRKPPPECARRPAPECLERIRVDEVVEAALGLLQERARA